MIPPGRPSLAGSVTDGLYALYHAGSHAIVDNGAVGTTAPWFDVTAAGRHVDFDGGQFTSAHKGVLQHDAGGAYWSDQNTASAARFTFSAWAGFGDRLYNPVAGRAVTIAVRVRKRTAWSSPSTANNAGLICWRSASTGNARIYLSVENATGLAGVANETADYVNGAVVAPVGEWFTAFLVVAFDGANRIVSGYIDGQLAGQSSTASFTSPTRLSMLGIPGIAGSTQYFPDAIDLRWWAGWTRALDPAEMVALSRRGWQGHLQPVAYRRRSYAALAAAGVTGTAAAPLPRFGAAGAGIHGHTGAAAAPLPRLGAAGAGAHGHTATGAATLPRLGIAGAGIHGHTATGAVALPRLDVTAGGVQGHTGTAAVALPRLSVAAAGSHGAGIASVVLPGLDVAAGGVQGRTGAAIVALPHLDVAAGGVQGHVGASALILPALTVAASGGASVGAVTGIASVLLPRFSAAAMAVQGHAGSGAVVLSSLTVAVAGVQGHTGTAIVLLPRLLLAAAQRGLFDVDIGDRGRRIAAGAGRLITIPAPGRLIEG